MHDLQHYSSSSSSSEDNCEARDREYALRNITEYSILEKFDEICSRAETDKVINKIIESNIQKSLERVVVKYLDAFVEEHTKDRIKRNVEDCFLN